MAFLFDGSTRPPTIITSATTMFTSIALIVSSIVVIGLLLPDTSQASLIPFEIDTDSTSVNAPPTPNQVRNDYDDSQGSSRSEPNHLDELSANLTRTTRNCHRRAYNFKAVNSDDKGRRCWQYITIMSCWGRCDSGEIADWRFPFKKSFHPVCIHEQFRVRRIRLRHCDAGVEPRTRVYSFVEALSCACAPCQSSLASCESLSHGGATMAP